MMHIEHCTGHLARDRGGYAVTGSDVVGYRSFLLHECVKPGYTDRLAEAKSCPYVQGGDNT